MDFLDYPSSFISWNVFSIRLSMLSNDCRLCDVDSAFWEYLWELPALDNGVLVLS